MTAKKYHLTPLPANARTRVGWIVLCFIGIIFSPFVGFAIHGKVETPGLIIGLLVAILPLCGFTALVILRWHSWRQLPPHIVEEQKLGRVFPVAGAPMVISPVRFSSKNKKDWIEMRLEGITLSRHALLRMQGVPNFMAKVWIAEQIGEQFVAWSDIVEWVVDSDSDGSDYYLLKLKPKGTLSIRRFKPDTASEHDLLDAVRSVGKLPVRLRCNIDCDSYPIL
jgi:hypothetical protein